MRKIDLGIYIVFLLLVVASFFCSETKTQWINDAILAITACIVLWYTRETEEMKREVARQNLIQTRPILILELNDKRIFLKNEGKGLALNGIVENFKTSFLDRDVYSETMCDYEFTPIDFIPTNKSRELIMESKDIVSGNRGTMNQPDVFFETGKNIFITLKYEDIEGNKYKTKIEVRSATPQNISFEKS